MPVRKLGPNEENKTAITLRRSPRFLQANQTKEKGPNSPNPASRKTRSFISKSQGNCEKYSLTRKRKTADLKISEKSSEGSRRSVRLNFGADLSKNEITIDLQKHYVMERRVTRSSISKSKTVKNDASEIVSENDTGERVRVSSKDRRPKVGFNIRDSNLTTIEKRITRSSSQMKFIGKVAKARDESTKNQDKIVLSEVRNPRRDAKFCRSFKSDRDDMGCRIKRVSSENNCKRIVHVGEKRKRDQAEEECENVQGWTKEQEFTLQRAYFSAKPTPHFWKKVARMVPGKSAKECFDRIHSDQLTPKPRTRSVANRNNSSHLSFSASKLLSPPERENKKLKPSKRRSLVSQKMVRQLLQTQLNRDQDYEADLFASLEPTFDSPSLNFQDSNPFTSPIPNQGRGALIRCRETSSSARKKHFLQLKISDKMTLSSPPVLKQIKNKAIHERYIDKLHCREAKRKAASLRNGKRAHEKGSENTSILQVNSVKLARDALVSDAQDAINQFRNLQSNAMYDNIDDDSFDGNEDDGNKDEGDDDVES